MPGASDNRNKPLDWPYSCRLAEISEFAYGLQWVCRIVEPERTESSAIGVLNVAKNRWGVGILTVGRLGEVVLLRIDRRTGKV